MCGTMLHTDIPATGEATRRVVRLVWLATRMQGVAMAMGQQKVG